MNESDSKELMRIYSQRFDAVQEYRRRVWEVLVPHFFQQFVPSSAAILDLGCGYGEFINVVQARTRFGMDMNPNSKTHLSTGVQFFQQDCSKRWPLRDGELDVVFTSNFFEHLPDKETLSRTLEEAFRCLKPQGKLIALGPNIKFTHGRYWDFWDHYLPLTELSLTEGLRTRGFTIESCRSRFLPYTMVGGRQFPLWMVKIYVRFPLLWRIAGQQFLVVARKP